MIQFVRNLLARCIPSKSSRDIFCYWDGRSHRRIDPMVVYRRVQSHPTYNAEIHPALAESGDFNAFTIMVNATRDVLDVKPFDEATGKGLTESETVQLMVQFADFTMDQKKSISTSPTSLLPTDQPVLDLSPTISSSGFGSISTEPNSDTHGEC